MVYVDENLCTGCAICLDACNRGAISLSGHTALIDEKLCTSCGRCIDVCLTGAIIALEIDAEESPEGALIQQRGTQSARTATPAVSRQSATAKLDVVERAFSGLVSFAAFALGVKRSLSTSPGVLSTRSSDDATAAGRSRGSCSRERQVRAGGRGPGGGRGRNNQCGTNRRNRTT